MNRRFCAPVSAALFDAAPAQGGAGDFGALPDWDLSDLYTAPDAPEFLHDMAWLEMWRQPLALCVPADHWLAGRSTVSLSDAAGEPFISTPKSFHSRDLLDAVAADEGIEAKVAYESDELSTVAGLVVAGIGVALLPADDPYLPLAGATFIPLRTERTR
ncbi:hypothetical protein EOM89_10710, partial [Candidatus Falkowbacteria bacterium]|nr:hypothetical protein [Candidatus Falkowbacteria bacterium]